MGHGIDWHGTNRSFGPPPGVSEEQCQTLRVFDNGNCLVSAWELTPQEISEVIRTKQVFQSIWGRSLAPSLIGSESVVHSVVVEYGPVWKLQPPPFGGEKARALELADLLESAIGINVNMNKWLIAKALRYYAARND